MKSTSHHLESLDAFRGLTIAGMILVNHPGDWTVVYDPLSHAAWNGCTAADVVFPFFLFIVGVATQFAFARRREIGTSGLGIRILRRAAVLVALGLILNVIAAAPHVGDVRIPGVLQRIGLVYAATAAIVLTSGERGRVIWMAALLAGYWMLLAMLPFGGHPAGVLTPAANLPGAIDARVFGRHLLAPTFDPEGLVSTLPAIASALAGGLAGRWLRSTPSHGRRVAGLTIGGGVAVAAGLLASLWIPLNKTLWTPSFALFSAGLASLVLAACYAVIDIAGLRRWARPFVWLGVNPLVIYFCSELFGHLLEKPISIAGDVMTGQNWVFWNLFDPALGEHVTLPTLSLIVAIVHVTAWIAVAGIMYRRGVRVSV